MTENKKVAIIISPNWRDYAKKYLKDCLESLKQQDWTGGSKIFLIDNETSEESYNYLKDNAPGITIIRNVGNDGFAKGNNEAMKLALAEGFDYIILFNMDTIVDKSAVSEMVRAAEQEEGIKKIGVVQARLMLWPDTNTINSLGNATNFLGFGYCEGYKEPLANYPDLKIKDIFYPSGAAVLFTAEALKEIGLFDEEFWMYNEDQDIGWRMWLSGRRCVLAPKAVVYHKYEFKRSVKQIYWMDRNRLLSSLKNYHLLTLVLILPMFLVMEIGMFGYALLGGWAGQRLKVYRYFFSPATWKHILKTRQEIQGSRKMKDKEIAKLISGKVLYQEMGTVLQKIANVFLDLYWRIIKRLIVW